MTRQPRVVHHHHQLLPPFFGRVTTDPNILESLLIDSLSWWRGGLRGRERPRAHREGGRRPGREIETDGRTRAAAVAKKVVFPHLMPAGSPALRQWQMGHRPTKEGPESDCCRHHLALRGSLLDEDTVQPRRLFITSFSAIFASEQRGTLGNS